MRKVVESVIWHILGTVSLLLTIALLGVGAVFLGIATGPVKILERLERLRGAALVLGSILGAILVPLLLLPVAPLFGAFAVVGGANTLAERCFPSLYEKAWANPEVSFFPLFD